jgi:mannose-6-phosphate isomerase-like protein (cupin superfamily)
MGEPLDGAVRHFPYAGDIVRVLGESQNVGFCEFTVPARFAGPPPHVHHGFDEAFYVLEGELTMVLDRSDSQLVTAGGLIHAPAGRRHCYANPHDEPARVLAVLAPGLGLHFLEDIGAALPASGPPDLNVLAEIYRQHDSEIVP